MTGISLARDLTVVLVAAFIGGILAKKARLPLVVGYLFSGILTAQLAFRIFSDSSSVLSIAQIGVALLLFTLGLELTIARVKELGEVIIFGSFIQIILTTIVSSFIFPLFGYDFFTSLFIGAAFSLSSTAVVIKTLADDGELETLTGELSAGWLFMQDLYTLPLLVILPVIGKLLSAPSTLTTGSFFAFFQSLFFAGLLFWVVLFIGKHVLPPFMEKVAELKNRELITIAAVAVCFFFSVIFQYFGLPPAVGAFVAGFLIATSSVRLGIFSEIRPLRDLFSVVFFVSLGFLLSPQFLFSHILPIFLIALFIMTLKFLISACIIMILGFHTKTAALVAFSLVSVGEFAFILALSGRQMGLIDESAYQMVLSVSIVTLLLGTPLISSGKKIYHNLRIFVVGIFPSLKHFFDRPDAFIPQTTILKDHVIVLGYGRVGKYICRALSFVEVPFIVIDFDHRMIKKIRLAGIHAVYGDPTDSEILRAAGIETAKAVIMAYNDRMMQEVVVTNMINLNKKVKIFCRTHFEEDQKKLKSLGVESVVQPEFEASITLTEKILKQFNIPKDEIEGKITRLRIEHGSG